MKRERISRCKENQNDAILEQGKTVSQVQILKQEKAVNQERSLTQKKSFIKKQGSVKPKSGSWVTPKKLRCFKQEAAYAGIPQLRKSTIIQKVIDKDVAIFRDISREPKKHKRRINPVLYSYGKIGKIETSDSDQYNKNLK